MNSRKDLRRGYSRYNYNNINNNNNMVKEKANSIRMYDSEGYRRRAACICVKSDLEDEVLLVTSSRRPDSWIVPGGGVEPEEEPAVTALREVREEAGVLGQLGRCLGTFEVITRDNTEHKHRTEVWVMRVTEELPEWEDSRAIGRKRKWFTIPEALLQLGQHKPVQRSYLHSLHNTNPRHNPTSQLSNHSHSTMASIELMNNSSNNTHLSEHS
ncbi:PREDICTED: diphosphoinositol polyphosphate phosphohydrolase 1 isoform X1 [Trachymyrmex cornetzi]|uniref:diphosphoinositol polyphosphate phosphohydrolase 1 isoform X1 n=1 Tax=Trachymyrmex cornetzi TaxID=471704 RepID=UPI00084EED2B|nr:PREDICTED: diphosphoinositol polyphosphate phosphohydrolase 1 isoform X1 [Trachymyrmex cornetzi]